MPGPAGATGQTRRQLFFKLRYCCAWIFLFNRDRLRSVNRFHSQDNPCRNRKQNANAGHAKKIGEPHEMVYDLLGFHWPASAHMVVEARRAVGVFRNSVGVALGLNGRSTGASERTRGMTLVVSQFVRHYLDFCCRMLPVTSCGAIRRRSHASAYQCGTVCCAAAGS